MLDRDGDRRLSVERHPSGNHLVERDAEGIDVGPCVRVPASHLLRRAVMNGSHRVGADGVGGGGAGDAEIRHLDLAVCGNADILRLHIPVDDPLIVSRREPHADLNRDAGRFPDGKLSLLRDIFFQCDAFDELHDDIIIALVLAHIVDVDDIRIGEPRRCLGLAPELRDEAAVIREFRLHDLHGHIPVQL